MGRIMTWNGRQEIALEKKGFRYRDIRVILGEEEFREWRLRLMG